MTDEKQTPVTEEPAPDTAPSQPTEEQPAAEKTKKKKDRSVAELSGKLDEATRRLEELDDQHKRMLAEYANYKRRTEQEKQQIGEFTTAELLKKLLPVVDNFDRAAEADAQGDAYKEGILMIAKQLDELLTKLGLTEIEALGQPFDPEIHYAVQRTEAGEDVPPDTVTAVLQKGYRLGDRLLRPAMVVVAQE